MRLTSLPTALRIQHPDVLRFDAVQEHRIQQPDCGRLDNSRSQLRLHTHCLEGEVCSFPVEVCDAHTSSSDCGSSWPPEDHVLDSTRNVYITRPCCHLLPLCVSTGCERNTTLADPKPLPVLTLKSGGRLVEGTKYSAMWSGLVLMAMITYVASYATGVGNIAWQQGELFRLEVRGIGTSLATATNWVSRLLRLLR